MTLFELTQEYLRVEDAVNSAVDGEIDEAINTLIDELNRNIAVKTDGYVSLIRRLESQAAAAKAEAEQYQAIAKAREDAVDRLKDRLMDHMKATGQTKIVTATARTVSVINNGGQLPLIVDEMPIDKLPAEFIRHRPEIDRPKIRETLERGETLPFARFGERGQRLNIR